MVNNIIDDIENKLHTKWNRDKIIYYTDGATESVVFSIEDKYLVKIIDDLTFISQLEFLKFYKNVDSFQKIICYDEKLKYMCFEFVDGDKIKKIENINPEGIRAQIQKIVESYKSYDDKYYGYIYDNEGVSWEKFLKEEIRYAKPKLKSYNLNLHILDKCLDIIKKYKIEKKLIHGDFGAHNFLIERNGTLKVIDPMPVIGDPLYDFYFALLSAPILFRDLEDESILNYGDRAYEYKYCLYTIVMFIRLSRAYVYDEENVPLYLERYKKVEKSEIYGEH